MVVSEMSVQKSLKSFGLVALTTFSLCFSGQVQADPACDGTFMEAMKNKAWMEAQREIMIAQSIIAKPDSVFALGCFDSFYTPYSQSITFFDNNTYAATTVGTNIDTYLGASFNHAYGGGHDPAVGAANLRNAGCDTMLNLWNDARCSNLEFEKIQTLEEVSEGPNPHIRGEFPLVCANPGAWEVPLRLFAEKLPDLSVGAGFDDMNLFWPVTAPLSEAGGCWPGIPTGVVFQIAGGTSNEVVCPNPGCAPDPGGACVPSAGLITN